MPTAIHTVLQLGMLYGIATLAVVVSFRFLRFPDLTVDGSFVLGAVVAAVSLRDGATPASSILLAASSGFLEFCDWRRYRATRVLEQTWTSNPCVWK